MTVKICVCNQKGGSRKTGLTTLITKALRGTKNLAIDCDPQGGLSCNLAPSLKGIVHDVLMGKPCLPYLSVGDDNTYVFTSSYELDKLYVTLDHLAFKRALKSIESEYDYIIFDTPPTMQGITRAAAWYSDIILVPCEVSQSSFGPTMYTLQCLEEIEKMGHVVIVGNRHEGYLAQLRDEMIKAFGEYYAGMIPSDVTSQKIIAGDIEVTVLKREKYLKPLCELIEILEVAHVSPQPSR
ncbi:MAG: ParA family protein [Spirochaetes bacterium]|nr:ParA family protein [Spirochaetota bacterium]